MKAKYAAIKAERDSKPSEDPCDQINRKKRFMQMYPQWVRT
jgi:hypothetical protein